MDIREVKPNLGKRVLYHSRDGLLSGQYVFNACTIRMNDKGEYFYQAELQQGSNSLLIVKLDEVRAL